MIDIRDYDMALLLRFKHYFDNTHWINKAVFRMTDIEDSLIYDGKEIQYPMMTLRRVSTPHIYKETNGWSTDRTGHYLKDMDFTLVQSNYQLTYELDVLSYERDNFDMLMVEVQENILRNPCLSFDSDDKHIKGVSVNLDLEEVQDNTDLEAHHEKNPLYRATLTLIVRAYIYRKYRAITIQDVATDFFIHSSDNQKVVLNEIIDGVEIKPKKLFYFGESPLELQQEGYEKYFYDSKIFHKSALYTLYGLTEYSIKQSPAINPKLLYDPITRLYWDVEEKEWSEYRPFNDNIPIVLYLTNTQDSLTIEDNVEYYLFDEFGEYFVVSDRVVINNLTIFNEGLQITFPYEVIKESIEVGYSRIKVKFTV